MGTRKYRSMRSYSTSPHSYSTASSGPSDFSSLDSLEPSYSSSGASYDSPTSDKNLRRRKKKPRSFKRWYKENKDMMSLGITAFIAAISIGSLIYRKIKMDAFVKVMPYTLKGLCECMDGLPLLKAICSGALILAGAEESEGGEETEKPSGSPSPSPSPSPSVSLSRSPSPSRSPSVSPSVSPVGSPQTPSRTEDEKLEFFIEMEEAWLNKDLSALNDSLKTCRMPPQFNDNKVCSRIWKHINDNIRTWSNQGWQSVKGIKEPLDRIVAQFESTTERFRVALTVSVLLQLVNQYDQVVYLLRTANDDMEKTCEWVDKSLRNDWNASDIQAVAEWAKKDTEGRYAAFQKVREYSPANVVKDFSETSKKMREGMKNAAKSLKFILPKEIASPQRLQAANDVFVRSPFNPERLTLDAATPERPPRPPTPCPEQVPFTLPP